MTNETVATGWVMYADEGPYTIDVRHVEEMVGTTREAAGGDRVRRGRDRRRWLVTNETAATGGVMYTDEEEFEFDEDEMAALEGQRLVVEFRCGIY